MKVYCLTHDGLFRNLIVTTHDGREAAETWLASSKKVGGEVVADPDDLKSKVSGTTMVILHTTLAKIANSYGRDRKVADVTKFESRSVGARRCFELIEELYQNQAPEAAAPPKVDEVAATTTTNEDEMAKGKKTKKVKAAKVPREKKVKGIPALVRETSSMGRILSYGVDGNKTLGQLVPLAKLADNGRNQKGRIKFRAKKVAALVGGTLSIGEDEVVKIKLPAGMTLDKAFGR